MKAFEGIRVLDLTHVLAGPFATYQLAVLGADVIKIERPDSPDMNREIGAVSRFNYAKMGTHFQSQAANKRAIALDLKSDQGKAIFRALAEDADVLVENFRAGAMERLGFGYEALRAINPAIVYCSITGFGQTGPKREHAAFDNTIQAFAGIVSATGPRDEDPVLVGPPVVDYGTGIQAAFAIASALLRRERTGEGQYLDVAMLDAALMLMSCSVLNANTTGLSPGRSRHGRAPFAGYGGYRAADGETLMIGACTPAQYARLWRLLGRDDLADECEDLRTADMPRSAERDEAALVEAIKRRPAGEWEALLLEAGLPAGRLQSLGEALASEQVAARSVVGSYPSSHSKHGQLRPALAAFGCSGDGPEIEAPPPEFAQHTRDVLAEIGLDAETIEDLAAKAVIQLMPSPAAPKGASRDTPASRLERDPAQAGQGAYSTGR
ncbi:MAG: CoA transferase [Rhodospirillales bacterium]